MNQETEKLVKGLRDLFVCRQDVFAMGYDKGDGKIGYPPARDDEGKDKPLTDNDLYLHLKGDQIIGVYPLVTGEQNTYDHVGWVALDFDEGEDPIQDAVNQQAVFTGLGVASHVERSRSGNGAHLWIFFDELVAASDIRAFVNHHLLVADNFDRMFPNQAMASADKYGNLIALPYNGKAYKAGNSCFIDRERNPIKPADFLEMVVRNRVSFFNKVVSELPKSSISPENGQPYAGAISITRGAPQSLSGAIKVTTFCRWMQKARERMSNSNQEPEFYALCSQFAQLEDGHRLAHEFGALHPYSKSRIDAKFNQAKKVNMPHTCKTLREEYDYECTCDLDYGVKHCYELANLSFAELMGKQKGKLESWGEVSSAVVQRAKQIFKGEIDPGWPYGLDGLDDLTEIRCGNVIVLAARTSIGKTSFAIDLSRTLAASYNIPCYWVSMEMAREELGIKLISGFAEVDATDIQKGNLGYKQWKKVLKANKKYANVPIYIDDETKDVNRMVDVFGEMVAKNGKGLIVVDYIELVAKSTPNESMFALASRVILELKGMARILDVPVLALSNFNRKAEQDMVDGQDPMDSWIRNSGLIEQTADVVLYLLGDKGKGVLKRKIWVQKERFRGTAGSSTNVWFDGRYSKFSDRLPGVKEAENIGKDMDFQMGGSDLLDTLI